MKSLQSELINQQLKHKAFGVGTIIEVTLDKIEVEFNNTQSVKTFVFPDSFGTYLSIQNEELSKKILTLKSEAIKQKELEQQKKDERIQQVAHGNYHKKDGSKKHKYSNMNGFKSLTKSNIAFKCTYCDGKSEVNYIGFEGTCSDDNIKYNIKTAKHIWCSSDDSFCKAYLDNELSRKDLDKIIKDDGFLCYESQMLKHWKAYAGIVQNGKKAGEPMTLRGVRTGSLAIFSTRLPYVKDSERIIFAVGIIKEYYEGGSGEEGYIEVDPNYRIRLSLEEAEKVKFWEYYYNENNPSRMVFGSGLHRYFTDIQSVQILRKIHEIKKGTDYEEYMERFIEHFCKLKKIEVEDITKPNGALCRG